MKRIIGMLIAAGALALAAAPAHAEERYQDRDGRAWRQDYRRDGDRHEDHRYRRGGEVVYRNDDCGPTPEARRRDRYAAIDVHDPRIDVHVGIGGWLTPRR